jgi:hypothetical protein
MARKRLTLFVGRFLVLAACVVMNTTSVSAGTEATTDLLFEVMAKIDSRFRDYRNSSASITEQLKEAQARANDAQARGNAARLSGDQEAFERARAEEEEALVQQILLQLRRVVRAREVLQANRRDLAPVYRRLRASAGTAGAAGEDRAQHQQLLRRFQDLAGDIRELALFFEGLVPAADPQAQSKLGATVVGLRTIQQAIQMGLRSGDMGAGGLAQVFQAVGNTLESMTSALAFLNFREDVLLSQKEMGKIANIIAMGRIVSASFFGAPSLNPVEIDNVANDEYARDVERGRRLEELMGAEGMGSGVPSPRETREALRSIKPF